MTSATPTPTRSLHDGEQSRLRRELHDAIGPGLAAIALRLDAAQRAAEDECLRRLLAEVRGDARQLVVDLRRLLAGLAAPALDDAGLVAAISEQAARLSTATAHAPLIRVDGSADLADLPPAVAHAAYRIAHEAMTNVVRHARARRCIVTVAQQRGEGLVLCIRDDGVGIGPDAGIGIGLSSMRERAQGLGGHCEVSSRPRAGTLVRATLPTPAGP